LRTLEQDGLVSIVPRRGARVIDPAPGEVAELFELLGTVYGAVAKLAARHASAAELQQFSRHVDELRRAIKQHRDMDELVDLAYPLGLHLGRCCGNPLAADMVRKLGRLSYLQYRDLQRAPSRWLQQSATRMRRLEEALRARSEERSERAARKLVMHGAKLVAQTARTPPDGRSAAATTEGHWHRASGVRR
jgi:DNA-binding GntR family transcriptional regulator